MYSNVAEVIVDVVLAIILNDLLLVWLLVVGDLCDFRKGLRINIQCNGQENHLFVAMLFNVLRLLLLSIMK